MSAMAAAHEPQERLSQLRRRLQDLREAGHASGMTSEEVAACIPLALEDSTKKPCQGNGDPAEGGNGSRLEDESSLLTSFRRWRKEISVESFSRRQKSMMAAAVLVVALGVGFSISPLPDPMSRLVLSMEDKALRLLRKATLPLHRVANISAYYYTDCIVANPWYNTFDASCSLCRRVKEVKVTHSASAGFLARIPTLYKGAAARAVGVGDIQKMVAANREALDVPTMQVRATVPWLRSAVDLGQPDLQQRILEDKEFHVEWQSFVLVGARLLRQLFSRPPFVFASAEVCIGRTLLVDGPGVQSYFPRRAHCTNSVLVVGEGHWEAWLHPPPHCEAECHTLYENLEPRDMLAFPSERYILELRPAGEGVGVALLMSYAPQ